MATSTLTLYYNNTQTQTFGLVSTSENAATWINSGRALSVPFSIKQKVKVNKGVSNDEVLLTVSRTEANATSGKLATCLCEIRVSLPKDQSILTPTLQKEIISLAASALIDAAATGATSVNRAALIEGRIL
jgi:hypothetical protein